MQSTVTGLAVYSSAPQDLSIAPGTIAARSGQELVFSYGAHDNTFLAAEYGFIMSDNPHASVDATARVIDLYGLLPPEERAWKLKLLDQAGYKTYVSYCCLRKAGS